MPHLPSMPHSSSVQSSAEALTGPHTHKKNRQTGPTDRESVNAGSHIAAFSHIQALTGGG